MGRERRDQPGPVAVEMAHVTDEVEATSRCRQPPDCLPPDCAPPLTACPARVAFMSEMTLMMCAILSSTKVVFCILIRSGIRNGQMETLSCFLRILEKEM